MSQSSSTELNSIPPISNGFWEIGNYKSNIHRIHQGSEQLEDFCRFIKDRIAIESNYSKSLERWNSEWGNYSEKYLKEGTVKETFDILLEESFELSKIHRAIKERFNDEVLKTVELYKRDNYHKSTFRGFKEAKEIEDEFEKAQKQWKKLYEKVESSKKIYYGLARAEKSAYIQYMNSKADPPIGDNQSEKCKEERYQKCRDEMERAKAQYKQQINEINEYNSIYVESMAFVFEKCQRMEMKRLRFYVEMLSGMQKILVDMLNPPKLVQLHSKLRQHFLEVANDAALGEDLKKWSQNHGIDSTTKWPEFEEYAGEFRQIHSSSGKSKQKQQQLEANGVVLTKKVLKDEEGEGGWRKAENGWRGGTLGGSEGSGSFKGGINRNGQFDKQNSIESRTTSSSTSKSSSNRSQSEKPHPRSNNGQQYSRFQLRNHKNNHHPEISRPQQQIERFNLRPNSSANYSVPPPIDPDPLATEPPFPMVTPQKGKEEEKKDGQNNVDMNFFKSSKGGNGNGMVMESSTNGKQQLAETESTEMEPFEQIGPSQSMQIGPAKVLYDYKPFEDDEIQLAKGETIEVLSGPDHLGWCLGAKKNKERGLFPAAYVSPILQMMNQ